MKKLSLIAILFLLIGCYKEEDYSVKNYDVDEVILEIKTDATTLPADGSSSTMLTVTLPEDAEEELSTVKITLSNGVFVENGSNEISSKPQIWTLIEEGDTTVENYVEHQIRSTLSAGSMTIEVEVQRLTKTHRVELTTHPISSLEVTPSVLLIHPYTTEEVSVVCQARSSGGSPSAGQTVNLEAKDSLFNPIGTFRIYNDETNGNAQTVSNFSMLPDSTYTGPIYFIAKNEDNSIQDTTIIYSKN